MLSTFHKVSVRGSLHGPTKSISLSSRLSLQLFLLSNLRRESAKEFYWRHAKRHINLTRVS